MLQFYLTAVESDSDKKKLEQLYNLYRKRMWYTANKVLNDSFEAEDAVHEAFIGISKNISSIGDPESREAFAYVITAAKNCALNIAMRSKDRSADKIESFWGVEDEKAFGELCRVEDRELIRETLLQMPEMYREVLYMHYCREMSEKEIASVLGRKPATVRQQIKRAKRIFASIAGKEGAELETV